MCAVERFNKGRAKCVLPRLPYQDRYANCALLRASFQGCLTMRVMPALPRKSYPECHPKIALPRMCLQEGLTKDVLPRVSHSKRRGQRVLLGGVKLQACRRRNVLLKGSLPECHSKTVPLKRVTVRVSYQERLTKSVAERAPLPRVFPQERHTKECFLKSVILRRVLARVSHHECQSQCVPQGKPQPEYLTKGVVSRMPPPQEYHRKSVLPRKACKSVLPMCHTKSVPQACLTSIPARGGGGSFQSYRGL